MKNLDCNQIINLVIIGEEDKNKKKMSIFFKSNKISAIWWREREREREKFSIVRKLDV